MRLVAVVTPLLLRCEGERHVFQCGDTRPADQHTCVAVPGRWRLQLRGCGANHQLVSRFVCDGRVNCMMPGREAMDEQEQFCSSARHTETDTGNKILSFIVIRMIRIQIFLPGRPCFYRSHHSRASP